MSELRLKKLQSELTSNGIYAILVSSPVNIEYLTGYSNFSRDEREAYLFLARGTLAMLFTDGRYIEAVKNTVPKSVSVFLINELFKKIKDSKVKTLGFEQNLTFAEYKRFKKETGKNLRLTAWLIEKLRAVKDTEEIKNIKLASKLTGKTYSHVLENIRTENITEKEVAWRIEKFIKENGGELAFESIVAFGPNSSIPHHKTSNKKLTNKDEFILLDFGSKVNGYCSDMTRTLLTKNSSSRAKKMYQIVLSSQETAFQLINQLSYFHKPVLAGDIANAANNIITKSGFPTIPHGLGHGIGLEVHEMPHLHPKSKNTLVAGNYFSIEPGIYLPGFGGVRIEDDYLLTDRGLEQLTKSERELVKIKI